MQGKRIPLTRRQFKAFEEEGEGEQGPAGECAGREADERIEVAVQIHEIEHIEHRYNLRKISNRHPRPHEYNEKEFHDLEIRIVVLHLVENGRTIREEKPRPHSEARSVEQIRDYQEERVGKDQIFVGTSSPFNVGRVNADPRHSSIHDARSYTAFSHASRTLCYNNSVECNVILHNMRKTEEDIRPIRNTKEVIVDITAKARIALSRV